jgi:hypothetical protein
VPPLPPGLTYVEVAAGAAHTLARRSDGTVVAFGLGSSGQLAVPPLPPGLAYVEVAAGARHSLARRSDGTVVAWGDGAWGQCHVPPLPAGLRYDAIAGGERHTLARRSDGRVVAFGDRRDGQCNVPPLPSWLRFAELAAGSEHSLLRASNGFVYTGGVGDAGQCSPPVLPPGRIFLDVAAGRAHSVALFGPPRPAAHAVLGAGCGAPPLELTAITEPVLHTTWALEVREVPPTAVLGLHVLGAADPGLTDLAPWGLPGCGLRASLDATFAFAPTGATQPWSVDLPLQHALVGVHLFATTIVWMQPATNSAGAITSNGIDGTIGT